MQKLKLLVQNVRIKLSDVDGYQSGNFKKNYNNKMECLYYNIFDELASTSEEHFVGSIPRIFLEIAKLQQYEPEAKYFLRPSCYNARVWTGVIVGTKNTPYHGAIFYVLVQIPSMYPLTPPQIRFLNEVFHPQVNKGMVTGIGLLGENFVPIIQVRQIFVAICAMLEFPNI